MREYVLGVLMGTFVAASILVCGAKAIYSQARSAGYAAAVDSVRAVERKTDVIRILDAYGASYTVLTFNAAGRETSMVHVGAAK